MANSKIILVFTEVPLENEVLKINESLLGINLNEIFKEFRLASGQTSLPIFEPDDGFHPDRWLGNIANFYKSALDLDYNSGGLFTITKSLSIDGTGTVTIEANYSNAVFTVVEKPNSVFATITNESTIALFSIDSIVFSSKTGEESSRCNVNIATNHLATKLIQPFVRNPNTENPIVFVAYRATTFTVEVEDANGLRATQAVRTPDYLNIDNFTLNINNSPNGATVTSTATNIQGLDLEYSLNNIDWQTSNVFTGLEVGTFMYWVRDQLGAVVSKNFTVSEFGIYTPFFYISKANSIRFANRITWGDATNYKNDENTLGAEVDVDLAYNGCQNFKTANIITTQFKSNYETNTVSILREGIVPVPHLAYTNFLLQSQTLGNAVWEKFNLDISGEKVIPTITVIGENHSLKQRLVTPNNSLKTYTLSFEVKVAELTSVQVFILDDIDTNGIYGFFNASTGTFAGVGNFGASVLNSTSAVNQGNGWYRISYNFATGIAMNLNLKLNIIKNNQDTYIGNGIEGLLLKNFQINEGALMPYLQTNSNPESVEASDGYEKIPVTKMTNNIGLKDKRDARKYNLGNGKTGIYFTSGNIYNFDTNAIIEPHYMSGTLPVWASVGSYINIGSAWFTIDSIFYNEDKDADVLVISETYTGADVAIIAGAIYNDFNYEVYEFAIDMVDYIDQTIQVRINNDDDHFESVVHLSEKIEVAVNFPKNVEIKYWNEDNTDVFYATGIRHLINVELTKQEGVSEGESDTYKTDTSAFLLSAQLYEVDKFIFEPVSKEIWRKLMIALSHKYVFINGVQYVKNGEFESEGSLDKSNLYVLKATMLKTGVVFNSDSADGADFNTGSIEIPGLIETEIGFVKY